MVPIVTTLYNKESLKSQTMFIPEGQETNPRWKDISLRYSDDKCVIEIVHNGEVVGMIANIKLVFQFLQTKEFYYGWIDPETQEIKQRRVNCDISGLMPEK